MRAIVTPSMRHRSPSANVRQRAPRGTLGCPLGQPRAFPASRPHAPRAEHRGAATDMGPYRGRKRSRLPRGENRDKRWRAPLAARRLGDELEVRPELALDDHAAELLVLALGGTDEVRHADVVPLFRGQVAGADGDV